jgi:hypothetical protein
MPDCYAELLSSGATEAEAYNQTLTELSGSELLAHELQRVERRIASSFYGTAKDKYVTRQRVFSNRRLPFDQTEVRDIIDLDETGTWEPDRSACLHGARHGAWDDHRIEVLRPNGARAVAR